MILHELEQENLIHPQDFISGGTQYLVVTGSRSYGIENEDSDIDLVGFCIPPKEQVFPHLNGEIIDFSTPIRRFQNERSTATHKDKEYDIVIYGIVKYFKLCMECNPNMIDTLFVPNDCILHTTRIGNHLRDNRKKFLSKLVWHKHKGYAYSRLQELKNMKRVGKRAELVEKYGFDTKFASNIVRLILQCEQILTEGDLDLRRNKGMLKAIRNGEWTLDRVDEFFTEKEKSLETVFLKSDVIPHQKDEDAIRSLLCECLEMHFGSLDKLLKINRDACNLKQDILQVLNKY